VSVAATVTVAPGASELLHSSDRNDPLREASPINEFPLTHIRRCSILNEEKQR